MTNNSKLKVQEWVNQMKKCKTREGGPKLPLPVEGSNSTSNSKKAAKKSHTVDTN